MNVFFVIDDHVITPSLSGTILAGVTRDSVVKLLRAMDIPVEERPITITEIIDAHRTGRLTESFGTGTAATIAHIDRITHDGLDLTLPPVTERRVASAVLEELTQLRTGSVPDPYGWIVPI
jgi:branched-chain amino acid aminotransferase